MTSSKNSKNDEDTKKFTCGIVMPIAAMGDYPASHWIDVQNIIKEAVAIAGYDARLVSESKDSTVIPKSIVQNLYDDDIVVCDVSGKNPNVMFELGMRLAFDKPVVLIKDIPTGYSFDTSTIEHLEYPRDLRYSEIQVFKQRLAEKIKATYEAASKENYRSFLSNFATIKIARLEQTTLSESEVLENILYKLDSMEGKLNEQSQKKEISVGLKLYPFFEENILYENNDLDFEKLKNRVYELYGGNIHVQKIRQVNGRGSKLRLSSIGPLGKNEANQIVESLRELIDSLTELPF